MWMTTEIQLVPKSEMNRATAPVYTFMVHIEKTFFDLTNAIYCTVRHGLPTGHLWAQRQEYSDV